MMNQPTLRMDKSRDYATVHGDRDPGDRHYSVQFFQDGLPFDANGVLVKSAITDPKIAELAERRLKKLATPEKGATEAGPEGPSSDDNVSHPGTDDEEVINLETWAKGFANYPWHLVTAAIAKRFSKRVSNMADAIITLVDEGVVGKDEVAARFQSYLV